MKKIEIVVTELQRYVDLEGTYLGGTCKALIDMWCNSTGLKDELNRMIEEEIRWHHRNFKENYEIITETQTIKREVLRHKGLRWKPEGERGVK